MRQSAAFNSDRAAKLTLARRLLNSLGFTDGSEPVFGSGANLVCLPAVICVYSTCGANGPVIFTEPMLSKALKCRPPPPSFKVSVFPMLTNLL